MASKFMDFSPSVATALKMGTPIVAIETGFFMRLPYPKNLAALQECEQALWRRDSVPCSIGVVDGRLKAGLSREDMDGILEPSRYIGRCPEQVSLFLEKVKPLLQEAPRGSAAIEL